MALWLQRLRRPSHPAAIRAAKRHRRLTIEPLEARHVLAAPFPEFIDPHPEAGNNFGQSVVPLSTGNVVVTAPWDDAGGIDAGAVYLFNGATGALISTLRGSTPGDLLGQDGVTALANGNYVVSSINWDNGPIVDAGAATLCNGNTGLSGVIASTNSLVGNTNGDRVGVSVTALANGNYVVTSTQWHNADGVKVGAATFGNGTAGIVGTVNPSNSLVGSRADDLVGGWGVTPLPSGNYLVSSPYWDNDTAVDAGAVTFGNGTAGITGVISSVNSLVGSTANDRLGEGANAITVLTNGNYVVTSPNWDQLTTADVGAVTFGRGTTGISGAIDAANSLLGTRSLDLAFCDVTVLANGNYVVASPSWDNDLAVDAGAVTFASGVTGISGAISPTNSLVGSSNFDRVGGEGVVALTNGNYVVASPNWSSLTAANVGAATLGNGTTGVKGSISAANSLIGSHNFDNVGHRVTALTNGNYVVTSPNWHNGVDFSTFGAATFGNGTTGIVGPVTSANSLVGSQSTDQVGSGGATALANGNYVVISPGWTSGTSSKAGAVTFGNGLTGIQGVVAFANSLVGSSALSQVGSGGVTPLTNGNYVVSSPSWKNGALSNAGAVTFASGVSGRTGFVQAGFNSLVGGSASDMVGSGGITALANGNYVVSSPEWNNPSIAGDAGAVTFASGTTGLVATVGAANSLIGGKVFDQLSSGGITALPNGNYLVSSPLYDNGDATDAGAVTFGSGIAGVSGSINAVNSAIIAGGGPSLRSVVLDATNNTFFARFANGDLVRVGSQIDGFAPRAPSVAMPAAVLPSPVIGTTAALGVLGTDDLPESNLTYTWSVTARPGGAADPTFSANGTNAAKNTTATFSKAGAYTFLATITDAGALTATSSVSVTVNATVTTIDVTPVGVSVPLNGSQPYSASARDQFGQVLASQPGFTWGVPAGSGSVNGSGLFTAGATAGPYTVQATSGTVNGSANGTVINTAPTIATAAAATPSPVTGTTTSLSVLGADDGGEANLTYTWAVTAKPATAADPTFSANGANAAKNSTATFFALGDYTFQVTARDAFNLTATSSVNVTVNQALTSIVVTPDGANLARNASQQYAASALDQFGNSLAVPPTFSWSKLSGPGSVSASGLFTATATIGPFQVRATSGLVNGTANGLVINTAPTVATPAAATTNPAAGITTPLSVLGADDTGEANLTYTWSVLSKPAASADPVFAANGTNGAKNTTITVDSAGSYQLRATISDGSLTVTSDVTLVVDFTLGRNAANPADATGDGRVDASDILAVVNYIIAFGLGASAPTPLPTDNPKITRDFNADGIINAQDLLGVINYIIAHPLGEGAGEGEVAPPAGPSANPPLAPDDHLLTLLADDVSHHRRRRHS